MREIIKILQKYLEIQEINNNRKYLINHGDDTLFHPYSVKIIFLLYKITLIHSLFSISFHLSLNYC